MSRIGALQLRDAVLDDGSYLSWDSAPLAVATDDAYSRDLAAAAEATGLDESVITGEGTVLGRRVALVACEFDFLAGSIGVAAAERITAAVERATAERLPLLASPSSGGTRMQEGTVAFLQMVKIAAAVALHKRAQRGTAVGPADAEILFAQIVDQELALRRLVLDHHDVRTVIHRKTSHVLAAVDVYLGAVHVGRGLGAQDVDDLRHLVRRA